MECNLELFTHVLHIWVFTFSATLYFLPPDFSFRFRFCRFRLFSVDGGTTELKWNIWNLKWFSLAIRHKNTNIDNRKDAYISQVMQMIIQVSPDHLHVQLKIILLVNALKATAQRRVNNLKTFAVSLLSRWSDLTSRSQHWRLIGGMHVVDLHQLTQITDNYLLLMTDTDNITDNLIIVWSVYLQARQVHESNLVSS